MTPTDPVLTPTQRARLAAARSATLATIASDGGARLVPICFVLDPDRTVLYSPIDEKPKDVADPRRLARIRDLRHDPRVTLLVNGWDEDWSRLWWLRGEGTATLLEPDPGRNGPAEHHAAVDALRAKYRQYATHDLPGRPIIRIELGRVTGWAASPDEPEAPRLGDAAGTPHAG